MRSCSSNNLQQRSMIMICVLIISFASQIAGAGPQRIASTNLCTDQYLLLLADRKTIVSVTWLAHSRKSSYYYQRALSIPANHGEAEEIIILRPDLVLAGFYSARSTTALLRQLGIRVEVINHPRSITQVRKQLLKIGDLIGHRPRAEKIIRVMDRRLLELTNEPSADAPTLMQYAPGGFTVGNDSLVGDIIRKAGWRNQAVEAGVAELGVVDLETLILIEPLALIDSPLGPDSYSFAEQMLKHPVLQKTSRPRFTVTVDRNLWICGGPMLVEAVKVLRDARINIEHQVPKL